jgi:hypothetical protein
MDMTLAPKGFRKALLNLAKKAKPTLMRNEPRPPVAPKDFDPQVFFRDINWYQKWEMFSGIFTPGINPISDICELMNLPADLSGRRVLDIGSANGNLD